MKWNQSYEDAYNKFIKEYSREEDKNIIETKQMIELVKIIDNNYPQFEVHFKNKDVFTVNKSNSNDIGWSKGDAKYFYGDDVKLVETIYK